MTVWEFLNSNFFIALVTALAGLAAFAVYFIRQHGQKKDAANIVLLEIQNAERSLSTVQESLSLPVPNIPKDVFLMPMESWGKYKYLFVRDFDRDQWDEISRFYSKCLMYDEAVKYNASFFQKDEEQIRINLQRTTGEYVKLFVEESAEKTEQADRESLKTEIFAKIEQFQSEYLSYPNLQYSPQKPINDAKTTVQNMTLNLTQTAIGTKLKRLARIKS